MIVENLPGMIRIFAEGNNKITNKQRSFYTDFIYLGKNDSIDNYEEVPYEIWGVFLENEIPKNKVEELTNKIKELEEEKAVLEDMILGDNFTISSAKQLNGRYLFASATALTTETLVSILNHLNFLLSKKNTSSMQ